MSCTVNRRSRTTVQAASKGTRLIPKYFVRVAAEISPAETSKRHDCWRARPANQNSSAHSQSASIITSHITLVAETRNRGVKIVTSAAKNGSRLKRRASANVPKTDNTAQKKKAECSASSLQPKTLATAAI